MRTLIFFIFVSFLSSIAASSKSLSYTGINGKDHKIEVFFPANFSKTKKHPTAIFFHGGGWSKGTLAEFRKVCQYFASRGMVTITANYTMHDKNDVKNLKGGESFKRVCVIDGKSVIRWALSKADEFGIDKENIVVGGASAGGHISLLSLLDQKFNNPEDPKITIQAKACLLFSPAFTILKRDKTPEVNVFNNLNEKMPPLLFFVGEKDNWGKAGQELLNKLKEKKVNVKYYLAKNEGHMFHRQGEWVDICLIEADNFLVQQGILKGKTSLSYKGDKSLVEMK